jgi:hypothetical protein
MCDGMAPGTLSSRISIALRSRAMIEHKDKERYAKIREAFAKQANNMIKSGVSFQMVLSVLADITLHMAIKIEKSGDSAAALKRLQDFLAQRFADMAKHDATKGSVRH